MQLTRNHLNQSQSFERVSVDVTEWGEIDPTTGERQPTTVFVRELSARERDLFEASLWQGKGKNREFRIQGGQVKLIILACCDAEGNRIFQESDAELLLGKSSRVIQRIYEAALKLNGFTGQDEEDLVKN